MRIRPQTSQDCLLQDWEKIQKKVFVSNILYDFKITYNYAYSKPNQSFVKAEIRKARIIIIRWLIH